MRINQTPKQHQRYLRRMRLEDSVRSRWQGVTSLGVGAWSLIRPILPYALGALAVLFVVGGCNRVVDYSRDKYEAFVNRKNPLVLYTNESTRFPCDRWGATATKERGRVVVEGVGLDDGTLYAEDNDGDREADVRAYRAPGQNWVNINRRYGGEFAVKSSDADKLLAEGYRRLDDLMKTDRLLQKKQ